MGNRFKSDTLSIERVSELSYIVQNRGYWITVLFNNGIINELYNIRAFERQTSFYSIKDVS
jgi:hypothetical protein